MAEEVKLGAFIASLQRNNKQIKTDRAQAIAEEAEITYKRTIEDLEITIKRLKRQRENMLDMSPENTYSLIVADKFDSRQFTDKDIDLGVQIREAEIRLEIAKASYARLFASDTKVKEE